MDTWTAIEQNITYGDFKDRISSWGTVTIFPTYPETGNT